MRFLYNRPDPHQLSEELAMVQDIMLSSTFVLLDLVFFSFLFTVLLSPVLKTLSLSILFFISIYIFHAGLFFLLKRWFEHRNS
ncbi:hypothetical protein [Bacillus sp. 1NLA3E]|uniref:hypothetical protein n=1 Tax=Bacillus sp. 1NLA3E TaxID=666686 RepID=UPI000247F2AF|nr:hypothetical protein [Bacillus sp. 1NLA3E]